MKVDLDKWYRPEVDKEEFRKLCEKSDWAGFKHVSIYFSVLIFFGYLAYATWGTWWSLLFFIIYGNIYACSDSIWHETGHKTAFKSNNFDAVLIASLTNTHVELILKSAEYGKPILC